jgi:hypothetical protein
MELQDCITKITIDKSEECKTKKASVRSVISVRKKIVSRTEGTELTEKCTIWYLALCEHIMHYNLADIELIIIKNLANMALTCHSEVGKLHSLFIKRSKDAFIDDDHVAQQWQSLNYLSKPGFDAALEEYAAFEKVLQTHCDDLFYLPADDSVTMDSIYCRDAAIATDKGMIICNMGKPARAPEPAAEERAFIENNISILGSITTPGTVEGGDVAWLDEQTLAVGHTYRTNMEGIRQLKTCWSQLVCRL